MYSVSQLLTWPIKIAYERAFLLSPSQPAKKMEGQNESWLIISTAKTTSASNNVTTCLEQDLLNVQKSRVGNNLGKPLQPGNRAELESGWVT